MNNKYLLNNNFGEQLYKSVSGLPIVDYHCHLSPKEIYEDNVFNNIGEMWLKYDHYKWRLMRTAGIDEYYITGEASFKDKFIKFAKAIEYSAGNPLYHWCMMELSMYFGIDTPLREDTAEEIWNKANEYIKKNNLSPRKLISKSNVEIICTTDDIIDNLEWHKKIKEDKTFNVTVLPSFRTDNLMLMKRNNYLEYLEKLSLVSGIVIKNLDDLKKASEIRLDYFAECGCRVTDVGMPYFPDRIYDDKKADEVFNKVLKKEEITNEEYLGLIGNLYVFFGKLYKQRNLIMQLHLSVIRNANSKLFKQIGADCGVDCVGDTISAVNLVKILDGINENGGLPKTVIYTLNNSNASQIASIAGSFPNVRCGAAWWFCDHKRGIEEEIDIIAENSSLGEFLGMLTDSRSFLSYARHDYFRRILCNKIGVWVEKNEYDSKSAEKLAKKICYENIKEMLGENL